MIAVRFGLGSGKKKKILHEQIMTAHWLCGFNKSNPKFMAFSAIYLHIHWNIIQFIAAQFFCCCCFIVCACSWYCPFLFSSSLKSLTESDSHHIMQRIYSPSGKVFCHKVHFIRKSFLSNGYFNGTAKDKHHQLNACKWHCHGSDYMKRSNA